MRGTITRRSLLAGGAAAGLAVLAGCSATGGTETGGKSTGKPVRVIDMHADTVDRLGMNGHKPYSGFDNIYSGDLASNNGEMSADRIGEGIQWVQCYSIWLPDYEGEYETDLKHAEWYREAVAWFHSQMEKHSDRFEQVRSFADIDSILSAGKVAAVLTVENSACLDEGIDMVDEFERDGVLVAGITWNGENALGSGNSHAEKGLTGLGKEFIAALEKRSIIADVSHLNEKGFWELEKVATKPYVATHSNAREVCDHLRNLTDDQFRAICDRGGVVGLNFNEGFVKKGGFVYTFDQLAAHVEHWLDIGGENSVALGSDRDGAEVPSWLANCSSQGFLHAKFAERFGEDVANKLFFENAVGFFKKHGK